MIIPINEYFCAANPNFLKLLSKSHSFQLRFFVFLLSLAFCHPVSLYGQGSGQDSDEMERPARGMDKVSFKTNALEWILTIPNATVEFDLASQDSSHKSASRMSISLTGKYNWNTTHTYAVVEGSGNNVSYGHAPPQVFNLWEGRGEFRYYWRYIKDSNKWTDDKGNEVKPGFKRWMKHQMMSVSRENPNTQLAWYTGLYASYGGYAFKFTKTGYQFQGVGLGASLGFVKPLYQYKKFDIDMEIGFSLGAMFCINYETFGHNSEWYYYYQLTHKDFKVLPFPVISELSVAFAFRTKSVRDKYLKETDWEKSYKKKRNNAIFELQNYYIDKSNSANE